MKAQEELKERGIYNCPECKCALGDDWEYLDFSNKNVIVCPQCKHNIYLKEEDDKERYPVEQENQKYVDDNNLKSHCCMADIMASTDDTYRCVECNNECKGVTEEELNEVKGKCKKCGLEFTRRDYINASNGVCGDECLVGDFMTFVISVN